MEPQNSTTRIPVALIVLDGWGLSESTTHNAIHSAPTPTFDRLWATCPHARFDASGVAVGLPSGQMGNSEIGHMAIGAGAPIDTDLVRINKAIERDTFASNTTIVDLCAHAREHGCERLISASIAWPPPAEPCHEA